MKCFVCLTAKATRKVIVRKLKGSDMTYRCCDSCEPRHIPGGDVVSISTEPLQ